MHNVMNVPIINFLLHQDHVYSISLCYSIFVSIDCQSTELSLLSDSNPRVFYEVPTQHPEKLTIWSGICWFRVVGTLFTSSLTWDVYLQLIEDILNLRLSDLVENNNRYLEGQLIFQQKSFSVLCFTRTLVHKWKIHWVAPELQIFQQVRQRFEPNYTHVWELSDIVIFIHFHYFNYNGSVAT